MTVLQVRPGYRFALRHDVDRFPDFVAKQEMTGTVTVVQDNGLIVAKMDEHIRGAEQWDNEIWWHDGISEFLDDTVPLPPSPRMTKSNPQNQGH